MEMIELKRIRNEIDSVDQEIVMLLAKRLKLAKKAADFKKANNMNFIDAAREKEIIARQTELAIKNGLRPEYVTKIYTVILEESHTSAN